MHDTKVTVRIQPEEYQIIADKFHHGQLSQFIRKIIAALCQELSVNALVNISRWMYDDNAVLMLSNEHFEVLSKGEYHAIFDAQDTN